MFSWEFCEIFKSTYFIKIFKWRLLRIKKETSFSLHILREKSWKIFLFIDEFLFCLIVFYWKYFTRYLFLIYCNFLGAVYTRKIISPDETCHLSDISAERCISLCKNQSFILEWIHPTKVGSNLSVGEISLSWEDFCSYRQVLPSCPN